MGPGPPVFDESSRPSHAHTHVTSNLPDGGRDDQRDGSEEQQGEVGDGRGGVELLLGVLDAPEEEAASCFVGFGGGVIYICYTLKGMCVHGVYILME